MLNLLEIRINQFEESVEFEKYIVDGELDVDGIVADFSSSEDSAPEEIEEEITDVDEEETPVDEEEATDVDEHEEEVEEVKTEKRTPDQAFAEMRRQLESSEPLAKWVKDLAAQQGFESPEQLIEAFEQQKLAKEAEQRGVPVDVYERLHRLEQENKEKEHALISSQFNAEVETAKAKYELTDDQINDVFSFMGRHGYISEEGHPLVPFEHAYILANKDNLIKDAEERGRQEYLEEKKRQQDQATPSVKTHSKDKQADNEIDYSEEAILQTLKDHDIYY